MKIKRPPKQEQLAITLVVHCGTKLAHVRRIDFAQFATASLNAVIQRTFSKKRNQLGDRINHLSHCIKHATLRAQLNR
jgi:hypothetical protein